MVAMRDIIDVWNIIDKYEIKGWLQKEDAIYIPKAELLRALEDKKNRSYIKRLIK